MTQLTPTRRQPPRRPALWAAAAAVVVIVAIGIPAFLSTRGSDPVVGDTTLPVATTEAPVTSEAPTTTAPTTTEPTTTDPTTTAPTTAPPVALIDISGLEWVRTDSDLMQIIGSDGEMLMDHPTPMTGTKSVAWDGDGGLVVLGGSGDLRNGDLRCVTPAEDRPVPVQWIADDEGMIVNVVTVD